MPIVIKIGGHLLTKKEGRLDIVYLKKLIPILHEICHRDKAVIVVGGGLTARSYIDSIKEFNLNESILDQVGINVARIHALVLASLFYERFYSGIPQTLGETVSLLYKDNIVFLGGLQPGQSTTTVAALVAEAVNARFLIIATNVEGIYESDPRKNPNARLLREVRIERLHEMFSKPSKAGEYRLLDTLTLNILARSRIPTYIINGEEPENILRVLKGEHVGTKIIYT